MVRAPGAFKAANYDNYVNQLSETLGSTHIYCKLMKIYILITDLDTFTIGKLVDYFTTNPIQWYLLKLLVIYKRRGVHLTCIVDGRTDHFMHNLAAREMDDMFWIIKWSMEK